MDEIKHRRSIDTEDPPADSDRDPIDIVPDSSRNEEFAAEFTADDHAVTDRDERVDEANSTYGWIGIALSVISFFMWPIVLGAVGIILGFVSRSRGADTLGNIAIAAGVISIIVRLFFTPYF